MSNDVEDGVEYAELTGPARVAREVLLKFMAADDTVFVCTDVDGVEHDIARLYAVSTCEGAVYRIHAGYPPEELAEDGIEACREFRGDEDEFLVDEAEHDRMVRDGVLEEVDGQNVLVALSDRLLAAVDGKQES